ncbi:hypothetical protein J5N97_017595 [Dioscorea zingiberensis]|uniref:Uncharacterized protein n=1 Tax=Dioscorea zingiberensis TaxID=325984 RepID=A0A9D5HGI8_9LILI|nr:hypothetical protein J5N97_017595 [Dioscorea zingiberensis]
MIVVWKIDRWQLNLEADNDHLKRCLSDIEMAVAGEVSLDEHQVDFDKFGILIKVKFRQTGQLQVLSAHHQSGGIYKRLVDLLSLQTVDAQAAAIGALYNLSEVNMDCRLKLAEAVDRLLKIVRTPHPVPEVCRKAAMILESLVSESQNRVALLAHESIFAEILLSDGKFSDIFARILYELTSRPNNKVAITCGESMCAVARKVADATSLLQQQLGRWPTYHEIAHHKDLSASNVKIVTARSRHPIIMNQPVKNKEITLEDVIPGPDETRPEVIVAKQLMLQDMEKLLKTLNSREEYIIRMHYGLIGERVHSCDEIGKLLNLSRERIRPDTPFCTNKA